MQPVSRYLLPVSCLLFVATGCASQAAKEAKTGPKQPATEVERYLPLEHDTVLSFVTSSDVSNEPGLLVIEVGRPRAGLVELKVAGRVQRLHVEADGVKSAEGGYLLKAPIAKDATFTGNFGIVKVTDINKTVKVPAGEFKGCVETVEEATLENATKKTTTVYCPNVGITIRQTEGATTEESAFERIELKSFGPRFGAGEPAAP